MFIVKNYYSFNKSIAINFSFDIFLLLLFRVGNFGVIIVLFFKQN